MGAASLAIGLALKSTLSNVASGGILLTTRPIKEGEFVEVAGQSGTVIEQGLYTTTLQGADGTLTTLPNDLILAAPVHNYSRHGQRRLEIRLVLEHTSDLEAATEVMTSALNADERVLEAPTPSTQTSAATPRGVEIVGRAWVATGDYAQARSDLTRTTIAAFREANIHLSARPSSTRVD